MVAYHTSGFWFKIPAQMIFETRKQVFLVCPIHISFNFETHLKNVLQVHQRLGIVAL